MDYRQTHLISGSTHLVCWLPINRRVRPGTRLTLKKEPGTWTVKEVYGTVLPRAALERGWRVGGML